MLGLVVLAYSYSCANAFYASVTAETKIPIILHETFFMSDAKTKRAGLPPPMILRYPYMPSLSQ